MSGEVGVTGWAVDDIGVSAVDIYRSPLAGEPTQPNGLVFLGAATLVEGARPDIAAAFPGLPLNRTAGWGYMLLTNMLPGQGNGTFTLHAFARDYDGRTSLLGSRVVIAANSSAILPFGTIDTPRQGETVSGTIVNFGWALTPQPNIIPVNGSTIGVYIDGVFAGHPTYDNFRPDIAALFPGTGTPTAQSVTSPSTRRRSSTVCTRSRGASLTVPATCRASAAGISPSPIPEPARSGRSLVLGVGAGLRACTRRVGPWRWGGKPAQAGSKAPPYINTSEPRCRSRRFGGGEHGAW